MYLCSIVNQSSLVNQRTFHGYEYNLTWPLCANIYPGLVDHDAPVPQRQTRDQDPQWGFSELLELVQGFELKAIIRTRYVLWICFTWAHKLPLNFSVFIIRKADFNMRKHYGKK